MTGTLKHHTATKDLVNARCPNCEQICKKLYYRISKPSRRIFTNLFWCENCEVPINEFNQLIQ